jgi:hypothetical protein
MADLTVAAETCVALGATEHQFESFPGRDIALGALTVTRVLPVKGESADARTDWEERRRFGEVTGYPGPRLAAPSLIKFATPNPAS